MTRHHPAAPRAESRPAISEETGRGAKSRLFGNRCLPQNVRVCVEDLGDLLPPSPPAEKAIFVMTLHARCVVTSSGPSRRHPAEGRGMIRCN
jgi:hypothetical protein